MVPVADPGFWTSEVDNTIFCSIYKLHQYRSVNWIASMIGCILQLFNKLLRRAGPLAPYPLGSSHAQILVKKTKYYKPYYLLCLFIYLFIFWQYF